MPGLRKGDHGPAQLLRRTTPTDRPNHNLLVLPGGRLAYDDTNTSELVVIDLATGGELLRRRLPGKRHFVRGLVALDDDHVVVGSQKPPTLYTVRLSDGAVVGSLELEDAAGESIFAIAPLPASHDHPPPSVDWYSEAEAVDPACPAT